MKTVKTKEQVLACLAQLKPHLREKFGLRELALFGSYARGDQRDDSDVDVLVDVEAAIGSRFIDLADEIERAVGLPTEVVSRRAISPRYFEIISKDLAHV
jgi:predicted nucleotidyltransferase